MLLALEAGFTVKAVIRKQEQAKKLKAHRKIISYAEKLEFAVVPEMSQGGAFDVALEGVDAALHLASPLAIDTDNYERDIVDPAVKINQSILESAMKSPSVKRVVITSSMVTLVPFEWLANPNSSRIYTSTDINLNPSRPFNSSMEAYWASKAIARLAVQNFITEKKPHFDIIQLLPSVVLGADDRATVLSDLRTSTPLWELKMSPLLGTQQPAPMVGVPVDVADVAKAHIDAINLKVPGNRDYVLSAETPDGIVWDDMINVARTEWPARCETKALPLGGTLPTMKWKIDVVETETAFGWKFRAFDMTIRDMIAQYLDLVDTEA
jgi:nucleoside-diphosphate-sugar epimerase